MYLERIADRQLDLKLRAFGAVHIVGPKWCGKTTTAQQRAKSQIQFQRDPDKESLITTAALNPDILLDGDQPRLIDEWQDAPNIWDAVRCRCDDEGGQGHFILTGSTSKKVKTSHTGTGRISKLKMYPMSLFESGESNGTASLSDLFDNAIAAESSGFGCVSQLGIEQLVSAACRGGWPQSVLLSDEEAQLAIARDYFEQIYLEDMFKVDDVKRNPATMRAVLCSYARSVSALAKSKSILDDVSATNPITQKTLDDYIDVLERLFVVEDVYGWCPAIRSATAMRSGRKREFVDPSLAIAAMGASPKTLNLDLKTFGFVFECLCIRDLRIYAQALGGEVSYYRDRYGLEADAVLHLADGRYALIEFKLGQGQVDEGAAHLCEIERLVGEHNLCEKQAPIRLPDLKMVVTAGRYGCRRDDGVLVVPVGCLRD